MWIPKDAEELETGVLSGSLEETFIFDAKRLPTNNKEIAKDIAAMTVDGGVIIYGIAEDTEAKQLTILSPIPLKGIREKITQIASTGISESPKIEVRALSTKHDPTIGYVVVIVPPSPRAPHMVMSGHTNKYYGRTDAGNYPLSEGEVARLYERRRRIEADWDEIFAQEIARADYPKKKSLSYMYLVARPILEHDDLLQRAISKSEDTTESFLYARLYQAGFSGATSLRLEVDGYSTDMGTGHSHSLLLRVDHSGSGHLFSNYIGETLTSDNIGSYEHLFFDEASLVSHTIRFVRFFSEVYTRAEYLGAVDLGILLTGLKGSILHRVNFRLDHTLTQFPQDEYKRTVRTVANQMKEAPKELAWALLGPFLTAASQGAVTSIN